MYSIRTRLFTMLCAIALIGMSLLGAERDVPVDIDALNEDADPQLEAQLKQTVYVGGGASAAGAQQSFLTPQETAFVQESYEGTEFFESPEEYTPPPVLVPRVATTPFPTAAPATTPFEFGGPAAMLPQAPIPFDYTQVDETIVQEAAEPVQEEIPEETTELEEQAPLPEVAVADAPVVSPEETVQEQPAQTTEAEQPVAEAEPAATPEAVAPEAPVPTLEQEMIGIDTIDEEEPKGNWLFKRIWWERSESRYEKLRTSLEAIQELRASFAAQRSEIDRTILDQFYITIGLGQGELQEIIAGLLEAYGPEAQAQAKIIDRELRQKAREDQEALKKLQDDVQKIAQLDSFLDDAITKLTEQVEQAQQYERQAWQDFKEIARVLNDKKAQEIFYKITAAAENTSSIAKYMQGPFSQRFEKLLTDIRSQVDQVKGSVQALKEKYGIEFKTKVQQLEMQEWEKRAQQTCQEKIDEVVNASMQEEPGTWTSFILAPISWLGSTAWAVVRLPYVMVARLLGWDQEATSDEENEQGKQVTEEETPPQETMPEEQPVQEKSEKYA